MGDRPDVVLARHFFTSLFDFGFLSDEGAESFKRALMGSAAVAMGLGLVLVRLFMIKYASLPAGSVEAYERAVVADHAFLMAVPMWFVAGAVGLAGQSLFPDETDYRILMAEPLSRLTIFGAKLAALLLFGGLFVAGTHVALLPLLMLTLLGAARGGTLVPAASAFALSTVMASLFAAMAIVAVHGLLVILAPRARLLTLSAVARSLLIGALVLSLPFIARLPGAASAFASDAWWVRWAPPAWFVGLERWLMGDGSRTGLAIEAIVATLAVLTVSVGSYVLLYRRFDRVILHAGQSHPIRSPGRWRARRNRRRLVGLAVRQFVSITLRRSVLHQGAVVALLAAAGGFVVNGLLAADIWPIAAEARATGTVIAVLAWAPMALVFLASPAVRLALSVPIDLRANWVFRMTEDAATRGEAVAAGVRTVLGLGVALPIVIVAPLQWMLLGAPVIALVAVEWLIGWLLVEFLMRDWLRIPFTCSYIPGKGFVPHMVVKGIGSYVAFTSFAGSLLQLSLARPQALPAIVVLLAAPAGWLCYRRTRQAGVVSLAFEDELPTDVTPLRLSGD